MSFELRDHTADVGVAATGETLEATFAALADGLAAASCDAVPETGERFSFTVAAEGREALLFDYLDELIYLRDVRAELPVENEVRITAPSDGFRADDPVRDVEDDRPTNAEREDSGSGSNARRWALEASARGVPLGDVDAREIKAVTYSEMRLEETDGGWDAYVVFDV